MLALTPSIIAAYMKSSILHAAFIYMNEKQFRHVVVRSSLSTEADIGCKSGWGRGNLQR